MLNKPAPFLASRPFHARRVPLVMRNGWYNKSSKHRKE
jgi:hypothetical protein